MFTLDRAEKMQKERRRGENTLFALSQLAANWSEFKSYRGVGVVSFECGWRLEFSPFSRNAYQLRNLLHVCDSTRIYSRSEFQCSDDESLIRQPSDSRALHSLNSLPSARSSSFNLRNARDENVLTTGFASLDAHTNRHMHMQKPKTCTLENIIAA